MGGVGHAVVRRHCMQHACLGGYMCLGRLMVGQGVAALCVGHHCLVLIDARGHRFSVSIFYFFCAYYNLYIVWSYLSYSDRIELSKLFR